MGLKSFEYYHKIKSILGLSFSLAVAKFKTRNEGSYLGFLWYLLEPLLLFALILFVRGAAFSDIGIDNYPIYLIIGLLTLQFFSKSTASSLKTIEENKNYIKNMKISHESLVISDVLRMIFSHFFEFIILVVLMAVFGGYFLGIIFYPLVFFSYVLFILGVCFLFTVIGAFIKDFSNVWGIFTILLLFASPVFYAVEKGTLLYKLNLFNPIFHYANALRDVLIQGQVPALINVLVLIFLPLFFIILGFWIFEKYKYKFAELI
jgi:ABC-type polysaccharide/polyol phosphate export permease